MMHENLSVILIARNEEQIIEKMVVGLLENYKDEILELIVVDDASTDRTSCIVEGLHSYFPKAKLIKRTIPYGTGRAIRAGFAHISPEADYVLMMDSDFIENIQEVRLLIRAMEENGHDCVIGSRFTQGSKLVDYPLEKRIANRTFHLLIKALFNIKQCDLTNNFRLYKKRVIQDLPWKCNGYAVNAEISIMPILAGYDSVEVPVSWVARQPQMGKSKFRIFKHGWEYLKVIFYAFRFTR